MPEDSSREDAFAALLNWVGRQFPTLRLIAAGHRVVHGGSLYSNPVLINSLVIDEIRRLEPLAPLHQPHNLAAIISISKLHPGLSSDAFASCDLADYPPSDAQIPRQFLI